MPSNIVLYKHEQQLIQATKNALSEIEARHHDKLTELESEDLNERISFLLTELAWLTDYSKSIEHKPQYATRQNAYGQWLVFQPVISIEYDYVYEFFDTEIEAQQKADELNKKLIGA